MVQGKTYFKFFVRNTITLATCAKTNSTNFSSTVSAASSDCPCPAVLLRGVATAIIRSVILSK